MSKGLRLFWSKPVRLMFKSTRMSWSHSTSRVGKTEAENEMLASDAGLSHKKGSNGSGAPKKADNAGKWRTGVFPSSNNGIWAMVQNVWVPFRKKNFCSAATLLFKGNGSPRAGKTMEVEKQS